MERWFDKEESEEAYATRLNYMKTISEVTRWASTAKALIYLTLHGKMKLSDLRQQLDLKGEKSIFRTIRPLLNAGLVDKIEDEANSRDPFYISTHKRIQDPYLSLGFLKYLATSNQLEVLSDYLSNANKGSMAFIEVSTELMRKRILDFQPDKEFVWDARFFEMIFEGENREEIHRLTEEYLGRISKLLSFPEPGKPLKNPVSLYLSFIPLT